MKCTGLPDSGFLPFREKVYTAALRDRIPVSGSIELTAGCNLSCRHCYIADNSSKQLNTEELKSITDQMADSGCLWLLLTGGEPLIREDFREIYANVKERGIMPMIFTNGTLITRSLSEFLAEMPPYLIEISIYGAKAETHDGITGVPGSFNLAMRGIENTLAAGLRLNLKTMAMTLNVDEIDGMKALSEGYGVPFRFDTMLNFRLDGDAGPSRFRLTPDEVVRLDREHFPREKEWRRLAEELKEDLSESDSIYQCGAGITTFHVDSTGRMSVCMMSRQHGYDLRTGTFSEGWNSFNDILKQQWSRNPVCRTCRLKSMCGQCPGWGYMEKGDSEARVEYLCRIACMRAEMLGLEELKPYCMDRT